MSAVQTEERIPSKRKKRKPNTIRIVEETPKKYTNVIHPTNLLQQKERFLKYGILPQFVLRASASQVEVLANKPLGKVSQQYLQQAVNILELVKTKFSSGDEYFQQTFGDRIDLKKASSYLTQYLNQNGLDGHMNIVFSNDLDCSARMMWHGPHVKHNRPEARKHTLIIKNSPDNFYLRDHGIICLANHEIGTHYMRTLNDGLQPWYADRKMFGLRGHGSYNFRKTEEGLAALNTVLEAKSKYLYGAALLYYIACMSETMTFKELFHHLEKYVYDPEKRWHYVMRVKRHLPDPNDLGGLGKDQCYFEGAMEILQDIDNLDIPLLYSGSLCLDETHRVKRLARLNCLKLPTFVSDVEAYRQQLRWIGYVNGVLPKPQPRRVKVKRLQSQQGARPGLRANNSKKLMKAKPDTPYNAQNVPSNMVLIDDVTNSQDDTEMSTEDKRPENTEERITPITRPLTANSGTTDSGCILEKLSSRLNFHDNLVKRVENKLSSAALSLKESQKIMYHGLIGKRGLATASPTPCQSPSLNSQTVCSPVHCSTPLLQAESSISKDVGHYTVQTRPPSQLELVKLQDDQRLLRCRSDTQKNSLFKTKTEVL